MPDGQEQPRRSAIGGFFDDNEPSYAPPFSTALIILLVAISVIATASFMVLLVLVRAFLMAPG
jgi:hypothetical protein